MFPTTCQYFTAFCKYPFPGQKRFLLFASNRNVKSIFLKLNESFYVDCRIVFFSVNIPCCQYGGYLSIIALSTTLQIVEQ